MSHFILNGRTPVSADPVTWRRWYASADRVVARTEINKDILISTVFVGLDMGCDPDAPLLFESAVMGDGVSAIARRDWAIEATALRDAATAQPWHSRKVKLRHSSPRICVRDETTSLLLPL
jgi:hypothetical protein